MFGGGGHLTDGVREELLTSSDGYVFLLKMQVVSEQLLPV